MNDTQTLKSIQGKAQELYDAFESFTRDLTRDKKFYKLRDGSPEWMNDATYASHEKGDIFPDDVRYEMIMDAAYMIANAQEDADLDELVDEIEPDIYNYDLIQWLASSLNRIGYVDEAVEELGHGDMGIIGDIMIGQVAEKREVFFALVEFLTGADDDEEEGN